MIYLPSFKSGKASFELAMETAAITNFNRPLCCARYVYNSALSAKEKHYRETGKSLSKRAIQDVMVLNKKTEYPWLRDINSQSLLAALDHLDRAFANFFSGRAKFPRYKKKYSGWQSIRPQFKTMPWLWLP